MNTNSMSSPSQPMVSVALIQKKRPAWQAGRLNGIAPRFELNYRWHIPL